MEVGEMKSSLHALHDKVSILTSMLDTFMKEMKGMIVEDVVVEEEVADDAAAPEEDVGMEKAKEHREGEEKEKEIAEEEAKEEDVKEIAEEIADEVPIQVVPPIDDEQATPGKPETSKKRKRRSRK